MASKIINLVALSTLAILAASFGPASTNALSNSHSHQHLNRHIEHAAKKRANGGRCTPRSSTTALTSTSAVHTTSSKPATALAKPPATTSTPTPAKTTTTPKSSSSSTSSKPSSTPSSSGSAASGSGKFGTKGHKGCVAWGNGNDPGLKSFKTDHVLGIYDWGVAKPSLVDQLNFEYWAMLWGGGDERINAFQKALQEPNFATMLMGFNEPNETGQSSMSPSDAAALWKEHIDPHCKKGHKCCSPAMSSRPNGQAWMTDFMKACDGCSVHYQCVHWYDIGFEKFQTYITNYHNQLNLPIIITEFADQNFNGGSQATEEEIHTFMSQALKWADDTDWIMGICPFGAMLNVQDTGVNPLNSLMNSDGTPSALGELFVKMDY